MPLLEVFSCRPIVSPEPAAARIPLLILLLSLLWGEAELSIRSRLVYGVYSNMRSKLVGLRRIIHLFICIFICDSYQVFFTRTRMIRCMKQNEDAV